MIRVVISDFGGVLTNPLLESFVAYQDTTGISLELLGEAMADIAVETGHHPLFELEKGKLPERDFLDQLGEAIAARGGPREHVVQFTDVYFANLHVNQPMVDYLESLKETHRLAMLTNNVREWEPRWRSMLPVDELFELVVDSAFVGTRKPEPEIYAITFGRLKDLPGLSQLETSECVLVDDVELNCDAAREFGLRAVHFHNAAQAANELDDLLGRASPG